MNSPAQAHRILVIEDDAAVRQTLVDILEVNGYRVTATADGLSGFAAAKAEPPAVILTDLAMPGLEGFELIERLHAEPELRPVPVIVISARVDRASTRRGMELGADDFITKPFTEDEVLHSIAARLEKRELLEELDAFAHTVAHDLRNPLSTLLGRLDLLAMKLGQADETLLRHQLDEATLSARRLNEIIDELLVLSGVRRQPVAAQPVDMAAALAEAESRLEALFRETGAEVASRASTWPDVVGHAPWVIEIWVNYLSNAAKYGGAPARIDVGAERTATGGRFWVQDRGPGLDAAAQARLFVPFARISTVRAKGHGLGLSIVRRIAEKLNGTAGVTSAPGQGARFWFELPATAAVASRPPPPLFAP